MSDSSAVGPDGSAAEVTVAWQVSDHGSAWFVLTVGGDTVRIGTTYLGDGLGSILAAAVALERGAAATWCVLPDEPHWTGLFFGGASDVVYVQAVVFQSHLAQDIWTGGRLTWDGRIPKRAFCARLADAAEAALADCGGEEGYRRLGRHPVPDRHPRGAPASARPLIAPELGRAPARVRRACAVGRRADDVRKSVARTARRR